MILPIVPRAIFRQSRNRFLALILGGMLLALAAGDSYGKVWTGGGITVRIEHHGNSIGGVIEKGDQTFPITAEIKDNKIVGSFQADDKSFPFTFSLNNDATVADFETGGKHYDLKLDAGAPQVPPVPPIPAPAPPAPTNAVIIERLPVHDTKTDLDVATVLVPREWKLDQRIVWTPDRALFVHNATVIVDPKSGAFVQWLPFDQYSVDPVLAANARQQGGQPIAHGLVLLDQALDPLSYTAQIVIPSLTGNQPATVTGTQNLPDIARGITDNSGEFLQAMHAGGREALYQAGRTHLEFTPQQGGSVNEADIYCTLFRSWDPRANATAQQMGMPGGGMFWPERLYILGAPKGKLKELTPLLETIAASMRPTAKWIAFTGNIQKTKQQIAINEGTMTRLAQEQITEQQQRNWENSMAGEDRIAEQFRDTLGGVQRFVEPTDATHGEILPDGYKRAFSDGLGRYIVTNDLSYNPVEHPELHGNWQEMQHPKP